MNLSARPHLLPGVELQATGSELLAHDTNSEQIHVLNVAAGLILTLSDGQHDVAGIIQAFIDEWSVERSLATDDVERQLQDFVGLGLIAPLD